MNQKGRFTGLIFVVALANFPSCAALNHNPLLLLISFDGFRFDLLNSSTVPHIWELAQKGVNFINGSRSQYLSYTAPNHAAIATGLFEETHGIVGNHFFDPSTQTEYDLFNETHKPGAVNLSLATHFYRGEPIWLTNERSDSSRHSASLFWPAGEAHWPTPPHVPTVARSWSPGKNLSDWMKDFDDVLDLFVRPKDPMNFVAWYVAEPDTTLHVNGFYNGGLKKTLTALDQLIEYVTRKLANYPDLVQRLNIILTADHGHAEINGPGNVFCLAEHINLDEVRIGDNMIYVNNSDLRLKMFENLRSAISKGGYKVDIYLKEDFPKRYAYAGIDRVGDIILEPHVGYAIFPNCTKELLQTAFPPGSGAFHKSTHGMDPDNWMMRSMLVMAGPAFREHYQVKKVANNIDLYSLMCHVLSLLAAPNNGTMETVTEALRLPHIQTLPVVSFDLDGQLFSELPAAVVVIAAPIVMLLIFCVAFSCARNGYSVLGEGSDRGYRRLGSNPAQRPLRMKGTLPHESALIAASSEDEL